MNREEMINSLALAMGVNTEKEYDSKKYNSQTGTIYCNDKPINDDIIKNAIHYFETLKTKCYKSNLSEIRTVGKYYEVAISALEAVKTQNILDSAAQRVG